jgi:hypothetical protein
MSDNIIAEQLTQLIALGRQSRLAKNAIELAFLAINDTRTLTPYRQGALWLSASGIHTLSGVLQIEANAPYVHFLNRLCTALLEKEPCTITKNDVDEQIANEWDEWLPAFVIWLPVKKTHGPDIGTPIGGLLFARDIAWREIDKLLLSEWSDIWSHAWSSYAKESQWLGKSGYKTIFKQLKYNRDVPWWKQKRFRIVLAVLVLLLFPVRLSILAPGELVPAFPIIVRSPLDGVISYFAVEPNQRVKKGELLFRLDETSFKSKLQAATETLATAEAEYRQNAQMAVYDEKAKTQLVTLKGRIDMARTEVNFLQEQLGNTSISAIQDGTVLFDDPSEWIGKPVVTGERVMRIATPEDAEIEAWIGVGDAIPLDTGAPVRLYLNANPFTSIKAHVLYVAYDAVQRPDGNYAYRVKAALNEKINNRIGLKGTARISGRWVPFIYWITRRPLATIRELVGW